MDALESYARGALELAGDEVDDVDMAVIRAAYGAYGPDLEGLDRVDLTDVWAEPDLDPSRPPRPR